MFKSISQNSSAEIIEKKSKFIANVFYVESVQEAEEKIKEVKRKYYDAKHNCFAYSIFSEEGEINRFSDDGEPSGTAGSPMLNIINSQKLYNVLVVVTRYFGGILLGTGGLVRAYSESLQKAIEESIKIQKALGEELEVSLDYNNLEIFKYYCKMNNIKIVNSIYEEYIVCKIELEEAQKTKLLEDFETKKINLKDLKFLSKKFIDKSI